jgi:acetyl esterase
VNPVPLDPQAAALLAELAAVKLPDLATLPPEILRKAFRELAGRDARVEEVASVEDRRIPGPAGAIRVRVYAPERAARPLPLLVYFHGGGFVLCDLDTHDPTCRALAKRAGCVVVSVDYRLAPEARFPAAPEDCFAAARWAAANAASLGADPRRVAVAGDSAGGNLAAVVSLLARERGGPALVHQLLVYPVTDWDFETLSYGENAEGYLLTRDMMRWFRGHYFAKPDDAADPLAAPLRAPNLRGLPPATVLTAEFDPLRDEGEAYARRLLGAGVPATLTRYDGMFHGFFGMTARIDRARDAVEDAARALRLAFED